jgi:autotransporter-associated beta strand protein
MNLTNTNDITATFGVHSITFSGTDSYTLSGNAITLNAGGILLDNTVTSAKDAINFDITLAAAQTWTVANANTALELGGVLSSAVGVGLTAAGGGTLGLMANNATLQGGVTLASGILSVGNDMALGTASVNLSGGMLQASTAVSLANAITVGAPVTVGGSNSLTFSGAVTLNANSTLTVDNAALTTFSGVLSGPGGLTDTGSGMLILSGANTYAGPTIINAGTLQLGAVNTVPGGSAVTVGSGATLDLNNFNAAIGSLSGQGSVLLGSGALTTGNDNSSTTFSGIVSGTGSITKVGTGTLTFAGNNTYEGSTMVSAGTLLVNGAQPGSNVMVANGAILGGAGMVGTIIAAGTVSPGGPGTATLTSGNVVFDAGSTFAVTLNGTTAGTGYDQLTVSGNADLTADPTLHLAVSFVGNMDDTFTIITSTGSLMGTFAGLPDNSTISANGQMFRINYSGNAATLTRIVGSTTTVVTSSVNPSVFGQPITFTATITPVPPFTGNPTGTVTFMEGTAVLGMSTVTNGVATFTTTTALSVGAHSITAVYSGDNSFTGSTSLPLAQTINQASSVTTVSSSSNPSSVGQSVTFTATVTAMSPGTGTPTGTVTFMEGATILGDGTLDSNGQATFAPSTLALGSHLITAVYNGDTNFTTSTSQVFSQNVLPPTMTTLTSSINPSVFGQAVTFTATVAPVSPGTGTPTGTVTFKDGNNVLGTSTLTGGAAIFSTSTLTVGMHAITATYNGDTALGPSTSAILSQVVNQASTTTTLSSSANPAAIGQMITFTATVTAASPGAGVPTGTVTFMDGTVTLGTGSLDATGHATFQTASLAEGTHSITANYSGDTNFLTSTSSPLTQAVRPGTTTVLVSSPNPSVFGQAVTFTATVSAVSTTTSTPSGTVTFMDGTTVLGTGTLNASGVATFTTSTLNGGTHSMTAVYSGDSMFAQSTSTALTQAVNHASTTTTLTSSLNPSTSGQAVTFTAVVSATAPGAGTPTGSVTFMDGTTILGTSSLTAGRATFQTTTLSVASHQITAVYNGDGNFTGNTSAALTQIVNQAGPTGTPSQKFVTQAYRDLLGRDPDPGGLSHFTSLIDMNQATHTKVAESIQSSTEARTRQVETLYQTFLSRQADPTGLDLSTRFLGMGGSFFHLQAVIAGSQEYFQRAGGTNNGFLTAVYRDALSRAVDSVGQSLGSQALANGTSRTDLAEVVFTSQEGLEDLVQSFYRQFLRRAADSIGLNASTAALQARVQQQQQAMHLTEEQREHPAPPAGASVDQLVGVIVGSDEYSGRL